MTAEPTPAAPDDKDWTWVLDQPCPECRFDAATVTGRDVPELLRDAAARFQNALTRPDASTRPSPDVWAPVEYGCHIRDVCLVFTERVEMMLSQDDPRFPNWDQDAAAIEGRYWAQDPAVVAVDLGNAAERAAGVFHQVREDQWQRTGVRSNGSLFTVDSLGRYFVHDLLHHVHDVGG
ncbi:MAG: DinB family protein [Actinomycetota bacterium]